MRHINIPVFIPHLGCPNDCVFCNQRIISGTLRFEPDKVAGEIERALSTVEADAETEIAFFGGSFTGIDRALMLRLLECAESFVAAGRVRSIRLSTRPDYIDDEILGILGRYSVRYVELGVQSLDDGVLAASKRGHTAEQALSACKAVREAGFSLVGQMMLGLPGSDYEKELATARGICEVGAEAARIYPAVVLAGTELDRRTRSGEYLPLSVDEAAERSAGLLEYFLGEGVRVLRVGLCESDTLGGSVTGGAYHPALGELAESRLYLKLARRTLDRMERDKLSGASIVIEVPAGAVSRVSGQGKRNKLAIIREYNVKNVKIIENGALAEYNIRINCNGASASQGLFRN